MENLLNDKKAFRKMALDKRNTLRTEEIQEKSALIKAHLENLDSYQKSNTVMVYLNFRSEVLTDELIENLFKKGKKVVVPISIKGTRTLLLSEIKSLSDDLELDFYNIRVPKKESIKEVSPADIDFVITPGVAFSKDKYRMGYGGGYYDTFIEKLREDAFTCALAFDVQIFDKIPKEEHDKQMDYVITENGCI
ncbi:putative 5-formyltetrahydrofolate cyclo-ligase [Acetoanaerobium sticklandii]|uniref:5-formyltetrahydrofolate cyclo-ligase n=1 Tax=Acetoanaerobium sticklandii (strain ATCC 12662 / DSM 519 / JCM 1433 / CCUG 9281 / NCIMB 10654 / HF) TaxID=499177 RepID=E3PTK5_ACESD|nr:5-formyltetrahydrofolate cyclo-ligase [Acetoanaerobium sticklandii]CBH22209.1 putative 5-formyltetrahydrofolate cyclo-ligase [Acetoanaerobium sticklandii]